MEPPEETRRSTRTTRLPARYRTHFCAPAINPDTGADAEYKELIKSSASQRWLLAMCKELGRLFQGFTCKLEAVHTVQGTNTCIFISRTDIPQGRKATYIRIVAELRPQTADPYRVRCTVGGNQIDFPGDKSTKVAELVTIKILLNNIVSTDGAKAGCIDIKDFYLNNVLPNYEYVFFLASLIPQEFLDQYRDKLIIDNNGHVYARVEKGMYGLPQAGKVASDALLPRLKQAGYVQTGRIPGLFKHRTNSIIFALVVDDFLVQYNDTAHFAHLSVTLQKNYTITTDMGATKFCGITLKWDYVARHVTLSMPGYVEAALQRFTHPTPLPPRLDSPKLRSPSPIRAAGRGLNPTRQSRHQTATRSHRNLPPTPPAQ
jgi:hypothetical protein